MKFVNVAKCRVTSDASPEDAWMRHAMHASPLPSVIEQSCMNCPAVRPVCATKDCDVLLVVCTESREVEIETLG